MHTSIKMRKEACFDESLYLQIRKKGISILKVHLYLSISTLLYYF